ncbi:MAG: outer membrane lipoprotein carrier protein LolA [Myxococcota bacterium]
MRGPRPAALALLFVVGATAAAAGAAPAADSAAAPWQALEKLRGELAHAGTLGTEFTQSYVPAGFESGETESGTVALGLPDCLRWDYRQPYAKSFLVCGARAWSWVEGEPRGQRVSIDADRELGLDLLLLPAAELARRYRVSSSATPDGGVELTFEPLDPGSELLVANLFVDAAGERPVALEWRDREGSVTSFRFRDWSAIEAEDSFSPPAALEWAEPVAPRD